MEKNKKKKAGLAWISGSLIFAVLVFWGGYFLGQKERALPSFQKNLGGQEDFSGADFTLFWDALRLIKEKYVHIDEVSDKDFLYGAIEGAITALKDPYSSFFPPSDAKKFDEDLMGFFGGIGAEIGIRDDQIIVVAPLKGNPAEKAGLMAGDKILKIDDFFTVGLSIEEAVKKIRGELGTKVALLVMRNGWKEAREFLITRDTITVPTLEWMMMSSGGDEEDIAYIHLYNFNANAENQFSKAALTALFKGTKGVILDLRNNPGGFLDVAVNISGWFLKPGDTVTKERFRSENINSLVARGNGALNRLPVVVLVNGGSASASEILAGALRDILEVKLVGEKTFGKGSVQELETLKDGSTLKISIAEWLTPAGHSIDKKGLEPDFEIKPKAVEKDGETEENGEKENGGENLDVQLEKAIEVLKPQLSKDRAVPALFINL